MRYFIIQFYYGNGERQERSMRLYKKVQRPLAILVNNENSLTKALRGGKNNGFSTMMTYVASSTAKSISKAS